jgi:hypothetical protein
MAHAVAAKLFCTQAQLPAAVLVPRHQQHCADVGWLLSLLQGLFQP